MIANHIHHALDQVRDLQKRIVERQRFRGYSGRARIICGGLALVTALVMDTDGFPATPEHHLAGWGGLLGLSLLINGVAVWRRVMARRAMGRELLLLKPVLDLIPPLAVGATLSVALLLRGHYEMLFGVWMSLYGLAHFTSRHALPARIPLVGVFYLACGAVCLILPITPFVNPWPMGMVFFIGEGAAGLLFCLDEAGYDLRRTFWDRHDEPLQHRGGDDAGRT